MDAVHGKSSHEDVQTKKAHVLVIPLFLQAHIAAIYRLAVAVAKKGVTVTFAGERRDIESVRPRVGSDELQGLDFRFVALESQAIPFDDDDPVIPRMFSKREENDFKPYVEKLVAGRKAGLPGPTCIVADRFLTWAQGIALQLEIPIYCFFSNGAVYARFITGFISLAIENAVPLVEGMVAKFEGFWENIPGITRYSYDDLPPGMHTIPLAPFLTDIGKFVLSSDGVVINTFYELESRPIDSLLTHGCWSGKVPPIFPVGPLNIASTFTDKVFVLGLENLGNPSLEWLDQLPPLSVLYICLGSAVRLSAQQIYELAVALEASQQNFLWVLPKGENNFSSLEEVLPTGYEERMKDKGKIVCGWVPQLQILGHASVGGFVCHCGWSSCIESITMGVPILAWPHKAEQHLNARYFVEMLKIAVELPNTTNRPRSGLVEHLDFESGVRTLMVEEEGKLKRARVAEMKLKAQDAVSVGGSSHKALDSWVEHMWSVTDSNTGLRM